MQELLTKGIGHKEFKETEIGRIPKDWEVVKLKDVCELIRGTEPGSKTYNTQGIGKRFIRVSNISKQILEEVFVNEAENLVFCTKENILLALDGVPGVVGKGFEGAISSGIRIVEPKTNKLNKDFLFHILQHEIVQSVIRNYTTGTTIQHASRAVDYIRLPLPPLSEQEKIADILSTLDEKIEIERKRREKLERIKKSLMDLLLTGKIRVRID
jgi:type I restriction enzyme S subunit